MRKYFFIFELRRRAHRRATPEDSATDGARMNTDKDADGGLKLEVGGFEIANRKSQFRPPLHPAAAKIA
jgi:hypothetical protein